MSEKNECVQCHDTDGTATTPPEAATEAGGGGSSGGAASPARRRLDIGFDHSAVPPLGIQILGRPDVIQPKPELTDEVPLAGRLEVPVLAAGIITSTGPRIIPASHAKHGALGFAISSAGPALACLASNPFDVAKTRMQLQNELEPHNPAKYRFSSSLDCLYKTYESEGVKGLQRGLSIAVLREGSKNLFRIGLFHPVLTRIDNEPNRAPVWKRLFAGAVSGAVAAVVCNPIEVIKTRMQSQGLKGATDVGFQHNYKGIVHAAQSIRNTEGSSVFFKGTGVSTLRSVVATAVNLSVFSSLRDFVLNRNLAADSSKLDASCSAIAAVCAVLVQHPVDLVRTRLYNQQFVHGVGKTYGGAVSAAVKIAGTEGFRGFYKGLGSHLFRTVPHFVLSFVFMGEMQRYSVRYLQRIENERYAREQASIAAANSGNSGAAAR